MENIEEQFDAEYVRISDQLQSLIDQRQAIVAKEKELRAQLEVLRRAKVCARNGEVIPVSDDGRLAPVVDLADPAPRIIEREPTITDHAMVRFLERHYEFDFQQLRNELLTDSVKLACKLGAASVKAHGGRWAIRGGVVTTFLVPRPNPKVASRRGAKARRRPDSPPID